MKIHRYFFWIDGNEIEIYRNGDLQRYEGSKVYEIEENFLEFWEEWEKRTSFLEEDFVDFTFIGKNEEKIKKMKDSIPQKYSLTAQCYFQFDDLKKVLQDKNLSNFLVKIGKEEYSLKKGEYEYFRSPRKEQEDIIFIVGEKIASPFLEKKTSTIEVEEEIAEKKGTLDNFFRKKKQKMGK